MDIVDRALRSIHANGKTFGPDDIRAILGELAERGRGSDNLIAHINPREAKLLKRAGGSGKLNPRTGLLEFDDEGGGGEGDGGGAGYDGGDSGGSDYDSGGFDAGAFADAVSANNDAMTDAINDAASYSGDGDAPAMGAIEAEGKVGDRVQGGPSYGGNIGALQDAYDQMLAGQVAANNAAMTNAITGAPVSDYSAPSPTIGAMAGQGVGQFENTGYGSFGLNGFQGGSAAPTAAAGAAAPMSSAPGLGVGTTYDSIAMGEIAPADQVATLDQIDVTEDAPPSIGPYDFALNTVTDPFTAQTSGTLSTPSFSAGMTSMSPSEQADGQARGMADRLSGQTGPVYGPAADTRGMTGRERGNLAASLNAYIDSGKPVGLPIPSAGVNATPPAPRSGGFNQAPIEVASLPVASVAPVSFSPTSPPPSPVDRAMDITADAPPIINTALDSPETDTFGNPVPRRPEDYGFADGGAVYDPMGNVTMPPEEGFAPSPMYEKAMDVIAKSGAAVGSPVTRALQTAADVYSDKSREAATENEALRQHAMRNMQGELGYAGMPLGAGQMLLSQLGTATQPLTAAAKTIGHAATQATGNPRFGENVEFLSGFVDPSHAGMMKAVAPMAGAAAAKQAVQTARELSPLGLYSHGAEAAAALQQAKGSPEQIIAQLRSAGVRPAELFSTGIADEAATNALRTKIESEMSPRIAQAEEALKSLTPGTKEFKDAERQLNNLKGTMRSEMDRALVVAPDWASRPSVTREEIAQHFREQMPQVEETALRQADPAYPHKERADWMNAIRDAERRGDETEANRLNNAWADQREGVKPEGAPKFQQYTLPGGENYREVLLKEPDTGDMNTPPKFMSSHWDDPNVLAHLRMADRTGPNGEKILHVEELQSDWGQQGRKEGFKDPNFAKWRAERDKLDAQWRESTEQYKTLKQEIEPPVDFRFEAGKMSPREYERQLDALELAREKRVESDPRMQELARRRNDLTIKFGQLGLAPSNAGVARGPYVTSTEGWTDLALKRVLKEAAEGGYDKVVFTPGAEQAKRYDLSKHIDEIAHWRDGDQIGLSASGPSGNVLDQHYVSEKKLSSVVGKELAEKIIKGEGNAESTAGYPSESGVKFISGEDLSVGGEGMKEYYDRMVPKRLQELVRRHDKGAKVGKTDVLLPSEAGQRGSNNPPIETMGITITPQMRESILRGQPHMADGGAVDGSDNFVQRALERATQSSGNIIGDRYASPEPVMRAYEPTLRERISNFLMGDERPSPERRRFSEGAADISGFTPLGIPMAAQEAKRDVEGGNYGSAAINAMGVLPAANIEAKALKAARKASAGTIAPGDAEAANTLQKALKIAKQTFRGSDLATKDPIASAVRLSERDPSGAIDFGQGINNAEYTFSRKGDLQPWREFDPVQAVKERALIAGLLGDRSAAGSIVHDIGGVRLTEPVNRVGGGEFQRSLEGPEVWASRPTAVQNMYTRIAKQMGELGAPMDTPLLASHVVMGIPGIDSTQTMAKGVLRQIEPTRGNIDLKTAADFDARVRKEYPGWPGILNPVEAEKFLAEKEVGARTSTILQMLDAAGPQKGGLPNLGVTRFAMMEPRLLSADQGSTGFAISKIDPKGIVNAASHDTYPTGMLGPTQSAADYVGGTKYQVPLSVMFPDWWKTVKPTYVEKKSGLTKATTPTMIQQSVLTQVPLQRANQEWLDNLMMHMERNPRKWGYRTGGSVSHQAMMIAKDSARRPAALCNS